MSYPGRTIPKLWLSWVNPNCVRILAQTDGSFFMFKSDPSFFLKLYSCSDLTRLFLIIFPVLGGVFLFCLEDVFVITGVTYYIF